MSLKRAYLLYEQSRYAQAEQEVRRSLSQMPQDAEAQALLALCLVKQEQYVEATQAAQQAIQLSPDWSFSYYALASVLYERHQLVEAEGAIANAIRLNPSNEAYFSVQAAIYFDQHRWQEALAAAELGLRLNPQHSGCVNLQAIALVKLNRVGEAAISIQTALQQRPADATTHANQGWVLLEQRHYPEAMQSFREALRLNPQLEWARQGVLYALKARNPLYGLMLRYFLWMAKLTPQVRWGIVLAGWFLVKILRHIARSQPGLAVWITPILVLYLLFVFLTWIADPLFNLLLRLDRYGRLLLSSEEIVVSNWVGGLLGAAVVALIVGVITQVEYLFLSALVLALLIVPTSAVFVCSKGWARNAMLVYTLALASTGFLGVAIAVIQHKVEGMALLPLSLFLVGFLASSFIANLLIQKVPQQ